MSFRPVAGGLEAEPQGLGNNSCHFPDPQTYALHSGGVNVPCRAVPSGVLLDNLKDALCYGHLVHLGYLAENLAIRSHPCNIKKCARPEGQENAELDDFQANKQIRLRGLRGEFSKVKKDDDPGALDHLMH
ncbi:MAG: hypothetical protein WBW16_03550 [Bacteroidota bacterium]